MGHGILVQSELVSGLQSVNSKSMEFGSFVFIAYLKNKDHYMYKLRMRTIINQKNKPEEFKLKFCIIIYSITFKTFQLSILHHKLFTLIMTVTKFPLIYVKRCYTYRESLVKVEFHIRTYIFKITYLCEKDLGLFYKMTRI